MADVALRRWTRLLELGAHVGARQRPDYQRALNAALTGAVAEAEALSGLDRVHRVNAILGAMLKHAPAEPVRSPLGSVAVDAEAAALFMESIHLPDAERRAAMATVGMSDRLAARLRALAAEGRT